MLLEIGFLSDKPPWKDNFLFGSLVPVQLYTVDLFWGIILVFSEKRHITSSQKD